MLLKTEDIAKLILCCHNGSMFGGKRITMYPDMLPSMDERSKVIGEKLKCVLKGRYFEWWIDTLVPRVKNILQPMHHGRKK